MRRVDFRDLTGGLFLLAIGLFVAMYGRSHYPLGQPAHMDAGFFPVLMGWILATLGGVIALFAFRNVTHSIEPPPFKPRALAAIMVSVLVFSQLIERVGLAPGTVALVIIAAAAESPYRLKRTIVLAVALAVIAWLIFIVGLQMQLSAFIQPR